MQYIVLVFNNVKSSPTNDEWGDFINKAITSGMFRGGSAIGAKTPLGNKDYKTGTEVGGFMRFDCDSLEYLKDFLNDHPVVVHGGTIEICEMPKT
jgi:hypothetical protein